ncbi:SDR family NAD(P)-dependent oxidoreductase [Mesorhizobium abyssinicae]|uniref:SDR family NAD(P)-dependent oxidoreductase n=1 Tax=Mesorhizobium abyssinicae TaxID=1209958 RepID=UPI003390D454
MARELTDIEKKPLVITGAAAGRIGQAIFRQCVANGLRVGAGEPVILAWTGSRPNSTEPGWPSGAGPPTSRTRPIARSWSITPSGPRDDLDVLINNAGINQANIIETADWYWERTFDINLTSIFDTSRESYRTSCWDLCRVSSPAASCTSKAAVASSQNVSAGILRLTGCSSMASVQMRSTPR